MKGMFHSLIAVEWHLSLQEHQLCHMCALSTYFNILWTFLKFMAISVVNRNWLINMDCINHPQLVPIGLPWDTNVMICSDCNVSIPYHLSFTCHIKNILPHGEFQAVDRSTARISGWTHSHPGGLVGAETMAKVGIPARLPCSLRMS